VPRPLRRLAAPRDPRDDRSQIAPAASRALPALGWIDSARPSHDDEDATASALDDRVLSDVKLDSGVLSAMARTWALFVQTNDAAPPAAEDLQSGTALVIKGPRTKHWELPFTNVSVAALACLAAFGSRPEDLLQALVHMEKHQGKPSHSGHISLRFASNARRNSALAAFAQALPDAIALRGLTGDAVMRWTFYAVS